MSETISFDEIPYDWRPPATFIEVAASYTNVGLVEFPARMLVIADVSPGGAGRSAAAVQLNTPYPITRDDQAAIGGSGGIAHRAIMAIRAANKVHPLDVIFVASPVGAQPAVYDMLFGAAPTQASTLPISIDGVRVPVQVAAGDTPVTIAAAVIAAVAANPALPFVASATPNAAGSVRFTGLSNSVALNAAPLGAAILEGEVLPPGLGVALTATAAGSGAPDITAALAAVSEQWYTHIHVAWAGVDAGVNAVLVAELARRFTATGRRDAAGYTGLDGTYAQRVAWGIGQNSKLLTVIGANRSASVCWEMAASAMAVDCFYTSEDPARQLRGLPLPGLVGPPRAYRDNDQEQDGLLRAGITPVKVLTDGTVVLDRVITTYQRSPLGVLDDVWLDVMAVRVPTRIRYDWASYLSLNWPRAKLADDDSVAAEYDPTIATPKRLKGSWAARCVLYERRGWIEDVGALLAQTSFVRNPSDRNRVDARQPLNRLGNLMIFAGRLEFEA